MPTWWSASAATSARRPTLPRDGCKVPARHPRGQRPAWARQPPRGPLRSGCRDLVSRHASCAARSSSGCRSGGRSRRSTARPTRAEAREHFGLRADLPALLVTGGSQGARRINQSIAGAAAGARRGRCPGPACRRARATSSSPASRSATTRRPYVVRRRTSTGWTSRTQPPTPSSAVRAPTPSPRRRPSACRPSSCRSRSATASRRLNAAAVVDAGGGILVADADFTTEWVVANLPGCSPTRAAGAMGAAARRPDPPRRRRRARGPGRRRAEAANGR